MRLWADRPDGDDTGTPAPRRYEQSITQRMDEWRAKRARLAAIEQDVLAFRLQLDLYRGEPPPPC